MWRYSYHSENQCFGYCSDFICLCLGIWAWSSNPKQTWYDEPLLPSLLLYHSGGRQCEEYKGWQVVQWQDKMGKESLTTCLVYGDGPFGYCGYCGYEIWPLPSGLRTRSHQPKAVAKAKRSKKNDEHQKNFASAFARCARALTMILIYLLWLAVQSLGCASLVQAKMTGSRCNPGRGDTSALWPALSSICRRNCRHIPSEIQKNHGCKIQRFHKYINSQSLLTGICLLFIFPSSLFPSSFFSLCIDLIVTYSTSIFSRASTIFREKR